MRKMISGAQYNALLMILSIQLWPRLEFYYLRRTDVIFHINPKNVLYINFFPRPTYLVGGSLQGRGRDEKYVQDAENEAQVCPKVV